MILKWGVKWPPSVKLIQRITFKDLQWTAVARYKCFLCGAFKRKKPCSPFVKEVIYYKRLLARYRKIYIIVSYTDGSVPWRFGIEPSKLMKKVDRGLKGAAKGMPLELHKNLLKVKQHKKAFILISGSCNLCRPCNVNGKCLKKGFAHSPEGVGIDVINTLRGLEYKINDVPYDYVVNVGIVCFDRRQDV